MGLNDVDDEDQGLIGLNVLDLDGEMRGKSKGKSEHSGDSGGHGSPLLRDANAIASLSGSVPGSKSKLQQNQGLDPNSPSKFKTPATTFKNPTCSLIGIPIVCMAT